MKALTTIAVVSTAFVVVLYIAMQAEKVYFMERGL